MSTISVDQRFELLTKLGENIDWDLLTTEQVQIGIREAKRAGAEVTVLARNGFRIQVGDFFHETGEVSIQIPALARPTPDHLIGRIARDTSPSHAVTLKLGTILGPKEEHIDGAEYERRIMLKPDMSLGYQHAHWLMEHQHEYPEFMDILGKFYIDFPGLVIVHSDGRRGSPYLYESGERWNLERRCVPSAFYRYGRIAVGK